MIACLDEQQHPECWQALHGHLAALTDPLF